MRAKETVAGATSHGQVDWHAIDWRKANRNVRRLQTRIVKATQEGRWGKVKALQHLLTHSHSGKALAVRRVTENQGKCTPGVFLPWFSVTRLTANAFPLKEWVSRRCKAFTLPHLPSCVAFTIRAWSRRTF